MGNSFMASYMASDIFYEMIDNREILESQYEVLRGRWPEKYNEMIVVLSDPSQITDYMAYTLGLKDPSDLQKMIQQVMSGQEPDGEESNALEWTYDDLMALEFTLVPAHMRYRYNEEYKVWEDMTSDQEYMKMILAEGEPVYIVGIVCPKDGVSATTMSMGVAYTSELTRRVIDAAQKAPIVKNQLADMNKDVFTGKDFADP